MARLPDEIKPALQGDAFGERQTREHFTYYPDPGDDVL